MEKLTVKNLGPIKDFEMTTNRLTVLIGPQASGKSLLAQMLYFFRGLGALLAERYDQDWGKVNRIWKEDVLRKILYGLRQADFNQFSVPGSFVEFEDLAAGTGDWSLLFDDRGFELNRSFEGHLDRLIERWSNKYVLSSFNDDKQVYIPTERSIYSRITGGDFSVYAVSQSTVYFKFIERMEYCRANLDYRYELQDRLAGRPDSRMVLRKLQSNALSGTVDIQGVIQRKWVWRVGGSGDHVIPLPMISSGQMETWPFFALATVYGLEKDPYLFYFEEPETHLHPNAQVEVVKTIAYLISRGHRFVITTHSPFILYVINNLIQAHIAYEGNPPDGEFSINPDHVAAYCLGENPRSIVKPDTKLLELREIDSVFDKLNVDFERYMDMEFARDGK